MSTAWELLKAGSTVPVNSTAWEHMQNLRAGSGLGGSPTTWEFLVDGSSIPELNTSWDHLNNLGEEVQVPIDAGATQFGGGSSSGALTMQKDTRYTAQIIKEDDELLTIITVMLRENKWPH